VILLGNIDNILSPFLKREIGAKERSKFSSSSKGEMTYCTLKIFTQRPKGKKYSKRKREKHL